MPNIHVLTYGGQSGNEIGDTGSCSIGEALKLNGSLQFLNLVGECWFFCLLFRGFSKISLGRISVFYSTCWLQSSNRIGDDGSCNIGEALNWNSSLRILNFVSVHSVSCLLCRDLLTVFIVFSWHLWMNHNACRIEFKRYWGSWCSWFRSGAASER
jgi:hypothetical protein